MLNDMLAQVQVKLILDILKVLGVDSIPATFEKARFSSEAGMSELVTAHVQSDPKHQSLLCGFLESQKKEFFGKNKYNYAYDFLGKADQYITNIAESDEWRSLNAQYDSNFYGLNVKDYFSFPDCTCAFPSDLFTGDRICSDTLSDRAGEIGRLLDDTASVQWMAEYKNSSTYYLQQLEQYIKILHELYKPLQSIMHKVNGAITCPPFSELFTPVGAVESPKSWEEFNTQNSVVINKIKSQLEDYHEWVHGLYCDYDTLVENNQSRLGFPVDYPTLSELCPYDDGTISWQSLSKYRSTLTLAFEKLSKDICLTSKTYETSQTQYNVLIERMQAIKDAHYDSMDSDAYEKDILNQSYEEFLAGFLSSLLPPKDATERLNSVKDSLDQFSKLCQAVERNSEELVHAKQNDRRPTEYFHDSSGLNRISSHSSDSANETEVLGANDTKLFPAQSQDHSFLYVFLVLVLTSVAFCIPYLVLAVPLWAGVVASVVTCLVSTFVGYALSRYDQTVQATKINDDLELGPTIKSQQASAQAYENDATFEEPYRQKVRSFEQCWHELVAAMSITNKPAPEGDRDSGFSVSPLGVCPNEELPKRLTASPSSQAIPSSLPDAAKQPNSTDNLDRASQQVLVRPYDFERFKASPVFFIVNLATFSDWLQQRQDCQDLHGFIPLLHDLATLLSDHHKPKQGFFGPNLSDTENFIELCQVDVSAVLPKLLSLTKKPQLLYDRNKASIAWSLGIRASTVLKNIDSQLNNKDTLLYKTSALLTQSGQVFSPELLKALARLVIVLKNVDSENLSIAKIGQAFFVWIDQALLNPLQDNVDNYLLSHSALSLSDSNYVYSIRFILRSHLESQVAEDSEGRCQLLPREQTRFYMAFQSLFSSSFFCDATFSSQWKDFPFRDQLEQKQFITELEKEDCDKNIRDAFQWLFKEFNTTTNKESWLQKHRKLCIAHGIDYRTLKTTSKILQERYSCAEDKQAFLNKNQSHTELKRIEATVDLRDVFLARLMFYMMVRHAHAILPDICAQNIVGLEGWLATMSKPGESLNPEPQVMKSPAF